MSNILDEIAEYSRERVRQQKTSSCFEFEKALKRQGLSFMIYQAKFLGAGAVLLICSILDGKTLSRYIKLCDELGLSALVEAHDEHEIKTALNSGARIIGVNNRNLRDFSVDMTNSKRLRDLVPSDIIFVSESGINSPEDVRRVRDMGANAVLIGEVLMRAPDKKAKLAELKALL